MRPRRVLIVTPFAIEPEIEGNRRRIKVLANQLIELGAEVEIAVLPLKPLRVDETNLMRAAWGKTVHLFPPKYPSSSVARVINKVQRLGYSAVDRLRRTRSNRLRMTDVDAYYFRWWNARLYLLQKYRRFDVVFAEYIFMSRAFAAFDAGVRKVIDTHDVFANRNSRMSASGLSYKWWSVTEADEADAINRSDAILAIEAGEADQFRRYTTRPVYCVPHVPQSTPGPERSVNTSQLLIVASGNPINVQGARWFITKVYPFVRALQPQVGLSIVGDVCNSLADLAVAGASIELWGRVKDLATPYAVADVVVNPVQVGTGLCIKSMEAMAYGRPLVSTACGARGIAAEAGIAVGDAPHVMAGHTARLLQSPDARRVAAAAGLAYLAKLRESNRVLLGALLAGTAPSEAL